MLKAGDRAPDFDLEDQNGKRIKLSDYRGKKLLLYFYPKADTPGCTTQACSIRDSSDELNKRGLAALGVPIVQILFERGSFTPETTIQTAKALLYYALGLWAIAGVRVTVPVFYSLHDTKTPVKVGAVCVVANAFFSVLLMGPLQHGGLALALTLASILNLALLLMLLRKKIGSFGVGDIVRSLGKIIAASLVMGLFSYVVCF